MAEDSFGTVAVFCFSTTGFERSEAAEFTLDRHIASVSHFHHFFGDGDVVLVGAGVLPSSLSETVHHDGSESIFDR